MSRSTKNTVTQAAAATTGRERLLNPSITATINPADALTTLDVELNMAGMVMAVRQA